MTRLGQRRPIVLTLSDFYVPGFKAGGPITTISNMVDRLGDEFDFRILTRDHDLGDQKSYSQIAPPPAWIPCGAAQVCYLPAGPGLHRKVNERLRKETYGTVFLNSFFSLPFSVHPALMHRLGKLNCDRIVVAPRGEMTEGALRIKPRRKQFYLEATRLCRVYQDVVWQASSQFEAEEIRAQFGAAADIVVAPDISATPSASVLSEPVTPKQAGSLKLLFVSRINPMKNLKSAIEYLADVPGEVQLSIAGPLEHGDYWEECLQACGQLSSNVTWSYLGEIPAPSVRSLLRSYDLMILPTLGEGYGHVIVEALSVGTPCLISDRTPWRNLARHRAGWDLPLDRPDLFRRALTECVGMNAQEHLRWREGAAEFWRTEIHRDGETLDKNRELIYRALGPSKHFYFIFAPENSVRTVPRGPDSSCSPRRAA